MHIIRPCSRHRHESSDVDTSGKAPILAHCKSENELEQLLRRYHLLEYSASQWGHHAVQQFDHVLEPLALPCLSLEKPTSAVQYYFFSGGGQHSGIDYPWPSSFRRYAWIGWNWTFMNEVGMAFHVAVAFGLTRIIERLLGASILQPNQTCHDPQTSRCLSMK